MPVRLVAVDLDGTLYTSEGVAACGSLEALRRVNQEGIRIVIATARRYLRTDTTYSELGFLDPLICWDGGQIYESYEGELWDSWAIPDPAVDVRTAYADYVTQQVMSPIMGICGHIYLR
jgi:hydroxymethylpyrimidine pyrophosphatase-like HAD family hydrolase